MYTVYIKSQNNFPITEWACDAYMGFRESQVSIVLFEDIEEVPVYTRNIVVSGIDETNKFLEKLGLPPKMNMNIPQELLHYAGREIGYTNMGGLCKERKVPLFVKPNGKAKEFIAGVISKESTYDYLDTLDPNLLVLTSEVVDFVSEYRGYVYDRKLQGLYWYIGDFRVFPDTSIIEKAISEFTTQPAGYSIDFGVTSDGRTLLIECNDGFSLGNYGLTPTKYSKLLAKRWLEMVA